MTNTKTMLLFGSALCSVAWSGAAFAADAPAAAAPAATQLEDVVVTATRQSDSVNRVALAITATTQKTLDQKGIKSVTSLVTQVPGLSLGSQNSNGVANLLIRGIGQASAGTAGASPTGFYLDDTPVQKRNAGGGVGTGNGTPIPALFDLERIEVLRGPQGTLYGGSSEGGTVRYITPTPSLTTWSSMARLEASAIKDGSPNWEVGVAAGGPIVEDKLGFRGSFYNRHSGGWIDFVKLGAGSVINQWKDNANQDDTHVFRGSLLWAPTENTKVTLQYLGSHDSQANAGGSYNLPTTQTFNIPDTCYSTSRTPNRASKSATFALSNYDANGVLKGYASGAAATDAKGNPLYSFTTLTGLTINDLDRVNPIPVARGAACTNGTVTGITFTRTGGTFGPYNFKKYQSFTFQENPAKTNTDITSLTYDYAFENGVTAKVISSYIHDENKTFGGEQSQITRAQTNDYVGTAQAINSCVAPTCSIVPAGSASLFPGQTDLNENGHFVTVNKRYGMSEEIRFASSAGARPLSWVGGVFYSNQHAYQAYDNYYDMDSISEYQYGITGLQRYGVQGVASVPGLFNVFDAKRQYLHDMEIAAFFEGNYHILDNLYVTGGIRFSRTEFDYNQYFYGPVTGVGVGNPDASRTAPTIANGGTNGGSVTETPTTPKIALNWNITSNDLVYISAAKGTRAGGINNTVSPAVCSGLPQVSDSTGAPLNQSNTSAIFTFPTTYKGDSVWSYELGGKFRVLDNRVQLNAALYHIDWKDAQYSAAPPGCGLVVTYNLINGGITSEGLELEGQASLFQGLVANLAYGWNHSYYAGDNYAPDAIHGGLTTLKLTNRGQNIATPQYRLSAGLAYNFEVMSLPTFARLDYTYEAAVAPTPYGISGWSPDASGTPPRELVNFRVGTTLKDIEADLFVNNLFDNSKGSIGGGRTGCVIPSASDPNADCHNYTGYTYFRTTNPGTPPTLGIQLTYRH